MKCSEIAKNSFISGWMKPINKIVQVELWMFPQACQTEAIVNLRQTRIKKLSFFHPNFTAIGKDGSIYNT